MNWSEQLSVKIPSIDKQHQKLVGYLNELHDHVVAGASDPGKLGPILDGLVSYTKEHFAYEEQLFSKHGYAEGAAHKQQHENLTKQVLAFHDSFKAGGAKIDNAILLFLKDWLSNHILKIDMKYSAHLTGKGVR